MSHLRAVPPIVVAISLLGVRGLRMYVDELHHAYTGGGSPINRDVLALPTIVIDDLSNEPRRTLKQSLDLVWNACDYPESPNFDDAGNWIGQFSF